MKDEEDDCDEGHNPSYDFRSPRNSRTYAAPSEESMAESIPDEDKVIEK